MTNDLFQRRRPNHFLCPQWCVMCKRNLEWADHLFLHCPVALLLCQCLFSLCDNQWVASRECTHMLLVRFEGFGGNKRAKTLLSCIVLNIFWFIWPKRNAWIFDRNESDSESLWDKADIWLCFGLLSPPFKVTFFLISRDWAAACHF